MTDSLFCYHFRSTIHFPVFANRTDIGADTTGPVMFIPDLYMIFRAGHFIHIIYTAFTFLETMGWTIFQAFPAVNAEIFFQHGICREWGICKNGDDTQSRAKFLCDQIMAVTDSSHSCIISCHHMRKCCIRIIYQHINVIITIPWEKDGLISQPVHNIIRQTICHIIQHPVAGIVKLLIDHGWRGVHHG